MFERLHSFTVHTKDDAEPILVKDSFSVWAFLFGGFWLLVNRVWIAGVLAILISGGLEFMDQNAILPHTPLALAQILLAVFIGLEAHELKREALARRGYAITDIVRETSEPKAELKHYERELAA